MAAKKRARKVTKTEATIAVRRVLPSDLQIIFSDSFVVSHTQTEYILSFLQTRHPVSIGLDGSLEYEGSVEHVCVSRIAVTPEQAVRILQALATNIARAKTETKQTIETKANGDTGK